MFCCLYDLIDYYRAEKGDSESDMYAFFRKKRVKKADLMFFKDNCAFDVAECFIPAIEEYTGLTKLEISLLLGILPERYRTVYGDHVKEISSILEKNYKEIEERVPSIGPCFETDLGKLYNADCIEVLKMMPDASFDLVFADPPFNLNKVYDKGINDSLSNTEYTQWCFAWISECIRILKPGGALFIYNIPKWVTTFSDFLNKRLTFRSWIAVDMKFSLPLSGRLYPAHYGLLYYIKGEKPRVYNNQRIPLQTCRHCGGEIKDYGGYKNKMNPKGVNVSDVWTDIYPVRHTSQKNREFNELSVKMLDRIISMTTNPGDAVFDPFGGSGTTYIVAEMLDRRWAGSELGNCQIIKDRFATIERDKGLLKKVYLEKDTLFPDGVRKLRKENGFWLSEDFDEKKNSLQDDGQLSLDDYLNKEDV